MGLTLSEIPEECKGGVHSIDTAHESYDQALAYAQSQAGDLVHNPLCMYHTSTGTLIGMRTSDTGNIRGWRVDCSTSSCPPHVNWWDWSGGSRGTGGRYGHAFFPSEQESPCSRRPNQFPWVYCLDGSPFP